MSQDEREKIWHREGNLLYTLKHAGWRKGKETFENKTMVRVEGDDAEETLKFLAFCLRKRKQIEPGRWEEPN